MVTLQVFNIAVRDSNCIINNGYLRIGQEYIFFKHDTIWALQKKKTFYNPEAIL